MGIRDHKFTFCNGSTDNSSYLSTLSSKAQFCKLVFCFTTLAVGHTSCTASCIEQWTEGGKIPLPNNHHKFFGKAKHPLNKKQNKTAVLGSRRQTSESKRAFATALRQQRLHQGTTKIWHLFPQAALQLLYSLTEDELICILDDDDAFKPLFDTMMTSLFYSSEPPCPPPGF